MTNPDLFIVAGPNGSGKSLFSKELTVSDLEVFDGDKHMVALVKRYPETEFNIPQKILHIIEGIPKSKRLSHLGSTCY
jgi:predicted ABC-type ATPase